MHKPHGSDHHPAGDPSRLVASLAQLIKKISDCVVYWNEDAKPFKWVATAGQILEKVAVLDCDFRKLAANNT